MMAIDVFEQAAAGPQPAAFKDPFLWKAIKVTSKRHSKAGTPSPPPRKSPSSSTTTTTTRNAAASTPPALPAVALGSRFDPFALSAHRSSASTASSGSSRAKHVPIVIPNYAGLVPSESAISDTPSSEADQHFPAAYFSRRPSVDTQSSPQRSLFDSGRAKPRHVEIVIPDWAQPHRRPSDHSIATTTTTTITTTASATGQSSASLDPPARKSSLPRTAQAMASASRSNTLDSNVSEPTAGQLYGSGSGADELMASANTSQSSLYQGPPERAAETRPAAAAPTATTRTPVSATSASGPSPTAQQTAGLNSSPTSNSGRSGLVCNVYKTTGREPRPLVGATTTVVGDKLYVFGGRRLARSRPQLTSDLYELDLIKRHWTKLSAQGDVPLPRYFHSVCPLGDTKLICYGGMSPAVMPDGKPTLTNAPRDPQDPQPDVVVMSDIHIYDIPTNTWARIEAANAPQGRYAHCATVLPSSAIFASGTAAKTALHHNPSDASGAHAGQLGTVIDGGGGAEMVVVGGQDTANHYIEQISIFNLRSLKWTKTEPLGRSCGAYRSIVAALPPKTAATLGSGTDKVPEDIAYDQAASGLWSMLIYSNYNFLDVKLELQIRGTDGELHEKLMSGSFRPPGLRFPNGGVIDGHFVVCGTFLTSSQQEYALWALDLKNLTWSRIDTGPSTFGHGSWNRGVVWQRRNVFVILGNRKRSLVEDYNHRQINFTNVAMVELESFGLYDNPRVVAPTTKYVSGSSPLRNLPLPVSLSDKAPSMAPNGRELYQSALDLGTAAMSLSGLADMDLLAMGGERTPVNSRIIAKRWGPYFNQILREGIALAAGDNGDTATLRPGGAFPSRNSIITITPSIRTAGSGNTTLVAGPNGTSSAETSLLDPPDAATPPNPSNRPRTLYLPHTHPTVQSLVYYLYTSSLPPIGSHLSTPQILCSLLQLARPYRVDGLLEAIIERLHTVLDGRNTAAIFNAAAMAAGGGDGVGFYGPAGRIGGALGLDPDGGDRPGQRSGTAMGMAIVEEGSDHGGPSSSATAATNSSTTAAASSAAATGRDRTLRINTATGVNGTGAGAASGRQRSATTEGTASASEDELSSSAASSERSSAASGSEWSRSPLEDRVQGVWSGDVSAVIGLQKRGLRGLMEGRRLREMGGREMARGHAAAAAAAGATGAGGTEAKVGLGIA